jgi:hypothetical protein
MATPPVFTAGQVLTAAQMNAVGLWHISRTTVGSAVSSVTVSSAFSSDYDNYRILLHGIVPSTTAGLTIRFGAVVTGYKFAGLLANYAGTTSNIGTASGTALRLGNVDPTDLGGISADIYGPNLADKTNVTSLASDGAGSTTGGVTMYAGVETGSTQHTDFSIQLNSGTMTGGTIDVYGYRKV